MPAWRIGFVAAEPAVIDACLRELEWDVIRVSHVAQRAATAALDGPQDWLDEVAQGYRRDRDAAHAWAVAHPSAERRASGGRAVPLARARRALVGGPHRRGLPGRRRRRLRHSRLRPASVRRLCDSTMADGYRIGVDIGGTFTDVVLLGSEGTLRTKKVLSTPDDYARGVVQGILELLDESGAAPASVTKVVHATTVASNAVLEGKGSRCALLTTAGFRDVLELRRLRIPVMYELQYEKPPPLVPRRLPVRDPRADRPARRGVDRAGRGGRAGRGRAGARGGRRCGRDQLPARLREPRPRAPRRRNRPGGRRRRRLHHVLLRDPRRDPRVRAHEHGGRERVRRPRRSALHPLARVEPGRGRDLGAASDHAVERRPDERRGRDPEAGAPGRVGAGRRCRRLRLPRARGRHPERDLARHGRDDSEGRDPRGRPAGEDARSTRSAPGST